MRQKQPSTIITFNSTAAAMAAERCFQDNALPGRLIPVPREITANCGLAWKAAPSDRTILEQAIAKFDLNCGEIYLIDA